MFQKFLCKNSNLFSSKKIKHMTEEDRQFILSKTTWFGDLDVPMIVRLYSIRNRHPPTCKYCGKILTKMKKYCGPKCYSQTEEFCDALKKRDMEQANEKRVNSMVNKYGVPYNSQREEIHHIWKRSKLLGAKNEALEILSSKDLLSDLHITQRLSSLSIGAQLGVYYRHSKRLD